MTSRPIRVSVVAYGAADLLTAALAGLGNAFPTTVVDNSGDIAVRIAARGAGADYIDSGQNLGFGAGHNLVLREVRQGEPTDVLLLNPDAVIDPEGVRHLQTYLAVHPTVGTVTPRLLGSDGQRQRELWPFPSPGRAWLEAVGLGKLNQANDFAVGSVLMLRWELLRDQLFDEQFFLYSEESDLQRAARESGWQAALCDSVTAFHVGGASSPETSRRETLFHAGTETHVRKWHGRSGWLLYRVALLLGSLARGLLLPGSRGAAARRRALIYLRGPRESAGLRN